MENFKDLVERIKKVPSLDIRKDVDGYFEIVLDVDNLEKLYPVLQEYFGAPFKPPGIKPTKHINEFTAIYGGIEKHQTLYYAKKDAMARCAMIWPWRDKVRVTVKLAEGAIE